MPSIAQFETSLGQALAAVPQMPPIAWPARGQEPARPFVIFDHQPTLWENVTLDGSEVRAQGYVVASICIAQGNFTTASNQLADNIMAAFPPGRRIAELCITIARPLPGFFDGVGWRQPVRIDYRSESL